MTDATLTSERPSRRGVWRAGLACVALLCVGGVGLVGLSSLKKPPTERTIPETVYNVDVFRVEPVTVQRIIAGFGTAAADRRVLLAAEVPGRITSIDARLKVGARYFGIAQSADGRDTSQRHPGDLLLTIDETRYAAQVEQVRRLVAQEQAELAVLDQEERNAQERLARAQADVDAYSAEHARIADLHRRGVASDSELNRSLLELSRYQDALTQARNTIALLPKRRQQLEARIAARLADQRLAEIDLERTRVHAPFSAVVGQVFVEVGQYVQPGSALVELVAVDRVEIPVAVTQEDATWLRSELAAGRRPRAALAVNELAQPRWFGEVTRLAPEFDEQTRTVDAFVEVDNRDSADPLLPGTFVAANIDGPVLKDILAVPREALTDDRVFIVTDADTVADRPVRTVSRWHTLAVLAPETLPRGTRVVLTNLDVLQPGRRVTVHNETTWPERLGKSDRHVRLAAPARSPAAASPAAPESAPE